METYDVSFGNQWIRVEAVNGPAAIDVARHDWPGLAATHRDNTAVLVVSGESCGATFIDRDAGETPTDRYYSPDPPGACSL